MTREREQEPSKTPTVLDPEGGNAQEGEPTAGDAALARDEALHAPEEAAVNRRRSAGRGEAGAESGADKRETSEVHQLLLNAVNHSANRMNRRLRAQIDGRVQIVIRGGSEAYLLDWRGEDPRLEERRDPEAECSVEVGAGDLFDIARGELNPQIAMLSDKIKVAGEARMAMYLFNLFGVKQ